MQSDPGTSSLSYLVIRALRSHPRGLVNLRCQGGSIPLCVANASNRRDTAKPIDSCDGPDAGASERGTHEQVELVSQRRDIYWETVGAPARVTNDGGDANPAQSGLHAGTRETAVLRGVSKRSDQSKVWAGFDERLQAANAQRKLVFRQHRKLPGVDGGVKAADEAAGVERHTGGTDRPVDNVRFHGKFARQVDLQRRAGDQASEIGIAAGR